MLASDEGYLAMDKQYQRMGKHIAENAGSQTRCYALRQDKISKVIRGEANVCLCIALNALDAMAQRHPVEMLHSCLRGLAFSVGSIRDQITR